MLASRLDLRPCGGISLRVTGSKTKSESARRSNSHTSRTSRIHNATHSPNGCSTLFEADNSSASISGQARSVLALVLSRDALYADQHNCASEAHRQRTIPTFGFSRDSQATRVMNGTILQPMMSTRVNGRTKRYAVTHCFK